jgi:tRNA (guanine37-N1)-methyltransferase
MVDLVFDIVTIFPGFFEGPFCHGIINQAQKKKKIGIHIHDLRANTSDRHKTVDDRPFGGGEGMVLKPEPIFLSVEQIYTAWPREKGRVILLSPQGRKLNQQMANDLSRCQQITLICGRYEGVDERVAENLVDHEISIGDYVLSGGELAACVLIDTVTRLIVGVLNNENSRVNESFGGYSREEHSPSSNLVLDFPQYTRPEIFRGLKVPEPLLSGNHKNIDLWRRKKALEKTLKNRPDLLQYDGLSEWDKKLLNHTNLES